MIRAIKRLERISEILVCPECKEKLALRTDRFECIGCLKSYPVIEGIPVFVNLDNHPEAKEIIGRDDFAEKYLSYDKDSIMNIIKPHHYISLMKRKVNAFLERFHQNSYILDVGIGWGWHFTHTHNHRNRLFIKIAKYWRKDVRG